MKDSTVLRLVTVGMLIPIIILGGGLGTVIYNSKKDPSKKLTAATVVPLSVGLLLFGGMGLFTFINSFYAEEYSNLY